MLSKQVITVSRGRSLIGREGVLIADLLQSYPSSRAEATLVMMDTWPLAPSRGFLNSPILNYLGVDSVSGNAVHVWHYFFKNLYLKTICQIWTLWFRLRTATHKIESEL